MVLLILVILFPVGSYAKKAGGSFTGFDSVYFETAVNIAGRDINRAIEISDSLYRHSSEDIHKVKSLMLMSTLFQQKGEVKKSIHYAMEADKIAVRGNLKDWEARIAGFLSTQYRLMGLYSQGEIYLEKGKEASKGIKIEEGKRLYLGMVYQETAYYQLEYEDYKKAYTAIKTASGYFYSLPDGTNKSYFLATNEELWGKACIGMKKYEEALLHYEKSARYLENVVQEDAVLKGLIYSGMGSAFLSLEKYDEAIEQLNKAEKIAVSSEHIGIKIEVYKTLAAYYYALNDYEKSATYNDKYIASYELHEQKKKQSVSSFVDSIQQRDKYLSNNQALLISVSSLLLAVLMISLIAYRRRRKKDFERFKVIMQRMKERPYPVPYKEEREEKLAEPEVKSNKKRLISEGVETKLLKELEVFEESDRFTDKNISLSVLSGLLDTNTKYLSYILNTHKNKDFNTYINELRIKYIIEKIENNEAYKNYKISYLADECGFSSHSKFSAVFKSVTGFTPSTFLDYLEQSRYGQ